MIRFNDHVPVIVCGARDGQPFGEVELALDILRGLVEFNAVVAGSRKGTDGQALNWAERHELIATVVPAQWMTGEVKGRGAGPVRNARMPRLFNVRAVAAFLGGAGTADMCEVAKAAQLPLWRWLGRADRWRRA